MMGLAVGLAGRVAPWLSGVAVRVIGIGIVLLAAFLAGIKLEGLRWQARWDRAQAEAQKARADAEAAARTRERALLAAREQVEANYAQRVQVLDRAAARARADGERLRDIVTGYADRRGAETSAAACGADDRAGRLAELVGEADRLAEDCARAADRYAGQVRGLQDYVRQVLTP